MRVLVCEGCYPVEIHSEAPLEKWLGESKTASEQIEILAVIALEEQRKELWKAFIELSNG